MPIKKDIMSVKDVIVMETAASLNVVAILSGTGLEMLVLLQAASMTKVSSIPIPVIKKFIFPVIKISIYTIAISRKISHKTYLNYAKNELYVNLIIYNNFINKKTVSINNLYLQRIIYFLLFFLYIYIYFFFVSQIFLSHEFFMNFNP